MMLCTSLYFTICYEWVCEIESKNKHIDTLMLDQKELKQREEDEIEKGRERFEIESS
jgi:hypothetical protein